MRRRIARRRRQDPIDQLFRAGDVGRLRAAHSVEHAECERLRQQALRFDRPRVEGQRMLEHANPLCMDIV